MTESSYYHSLGSYYLNHSDYEAIEIKFTRTNRLSFSCLPAHQEEALLKQWYYKIPDVGVQRKPLDIVLKRKECPIIVVYYSPRHTEIYEIPIRTFLKEKYEGTEKSLSKERAGEIGRRVKL